MQKIFFNRDIQDEKGEFSSLFLYKRFHVGGKMVNIVVSYTQSNKL